MMTHVQRMPEEVYRAKRDEVVLDVGASKGDFATLIFEDMPSRVVCVEASPRHIPALKSCLQVLNERRGQVVYEVVDRALVGSRSGDVVECRGDLYWNPECAYVVPGKTTSDASLDLARTMTFSDLVSETKLNKIDFMKMDIEGCEFDIMLNEEEFTKLSQKIDRCIFEMHLHYLRDVLGISPSDAISALRHVIDRLQVSGFDVMLSHGRDRHGRPLPFHDLTNDVYCIDLFAQRQVR